MRQAILGDDLKQRGYDFGIRNRIMVVTDPTFVDLIRSREAVAYGQTASFGLLVDVPTIYLVFKDAESATQCFNIFKGWIQSSGQDADAVDISFLDLEDGSHGIVLGPDINRLLNRTVPPALQDEYEPLIYAPNIMVQIPQTSQGYKWFKAVASGKPFVIAPATASEGILMNLAFQKQEAVFYKEDEVPQGHHATAHTGQGQSLLPGRRAPPLNAEEVAERRAHQLKRFFPVTLERLRFSELFERSLEVLVVEGFERWQVQQAACNLTLKHRNPVLYAEAPENGDATTPSILDYLLSTPETVSDVPLVPEHLTPENLIQQAVADSRYLLHHVVPKTPDDLSAPAIRDALKQHGLIET